MLELENIIEEYKKLEENIGLPFKKGRMIMLKNRMAKILMREGISECHLTDWVIVHHPKTIYKNYPNGLIQIISKDGYARMKQWSYKGEVIDPND